MGMSKAMMEKVAQAFARNNPTARTVVSTVRYGNVMMSRGSVIPMFVEQVRAGVPMTVTDPGMTRFLMSLDEAVHLVEYAFGKARPGDLYVRKAPASTVGDLATAVATAMGREAELKVIGTRHGEKLYETLATREELSRAEDQGDYYRVAVDARDLNYSEYFDEGDLGETQLDDYHSHNTERLGVPQVVDAAAVAAGVPGTGSAIDVVELSIAFITTGVVMVPLLALLRRHQVMDVPNVRSSHAAVVPRGGGIAVLVGVAVGALSALVVEPGSTAPPHRSVVAAVTLGVLLFAVLGLVDDVRRVPAGVRLMFQAGIAAAVAVTIAVADTSTWWGGLAVAVVGSLWLVSYVNAFNFMDGINAISAMSALLAACWFGGLAAHDSDPLVYAASWALAGAALGFLPWNAPRARVFLGDVGSYGIGALIGMLALLTALREHDVWVALAPLVIYLVDTSGTLVRRALRGEPLLEAHRSHVYQRLLDLGFSHLAATAVVVLAGVVICVATLVLPTAAAILVAVVVGATYLALPHLLGTRHPGVAS